MGAGFWLIWGMLLEQRCGCSYQEEELDVFNCVSELAGEGIARRSSRRLDGGQLQLSLMDGGQE